MWTAIHKIIRVVKPMHIYCRLNWSVVNKFVCEIWYLGSIVVYKTTQQIFPILYMYCYVVSHFTIYISGMRKTIDEIPE